MFKEVRSLLKLALPIMIGQVGQVIINLTDTVMVGRVGAYDLAAVAFANSIFMIFMSFGFGFTNIISALIAKAQGAGKNKECGEYWRTGLNIAISAGILLYLLMILISFFFEHFGQESLVVEKSKYYYFIVAGSIIPVMFFQACKQFSEGLSYTKAPMWIMLTGVVLNFFGNYIFIFGFGSIPALGITGAGISTFLSRFIIAAALFILVLRSSNYKQFLPEKLLGFGQLQKVKEILKLGLPGSFIILFEMGAFATAAIMMGWLGASALAAHQIAISLASSSFMVAIGIGVAGSIRVAYESGRNDYISVRRSGFTSMFVSTVFMSTCGIIFWLFRAPLTAFYVQDEQVLSIARDLIFIAAFFQVCDGLQVVSVTLLRGLQDIKTPFFITLTGYWFFTIPLVYITAFKLEYGYKGIWWSLCFGLTFVAVILVYRFHKLTARQIHSPRSLQAD